MPNNSLWNLIIKITSLMAVLFLLLGAAISYASHFGAMQNSVALVLTIFFAGGLAAFSLVTVNYRSFNLERELKNAAEIARQIAGGELLEEEVKNENQLFAALQEISDNQRQTAACADLIAAGD